ncbi:MAG TPA: hypothetical protein VMG37_19985 [Solirubrobacteraceae bacterium]|nr:hypothetical protein [Solirubrobacteraceae bacterium]
MFRKLYKKRLAAIAFVAALAVTGAAVAYFTGGTATDTGSGTVGSPTPWVFTLGTPTWSGSLAALYPGAANDTEFIPFTVTNNGAGPQSVTKITATLPAETNGDAENASGDIPGCLASWFKATADASNPALPASVAPGGGTYAGKIDLTIQNANASQNTCQGAAPEVKVTVS